MVECVRLIYARVCVGHLVRVRDRVRVRVGDRVGVAHPDAPTCGTVTSTGVGWLSPLATPLPRADEPRPRPRPG